VELGAVPLFEMRSDNARGGGVDNVPVVDETEIVAIEPVDGLLARCVAAGILFRQQDDSEQAFLVLAGSQKSADRAQGGVPEFPGDPAQLWNVNSKELVAGPIFALGGLEEPAGLGRDTGVGQRAQGDSNLLVRRG